ncbi:MAG: glycosyltransferase family 2 protein [Arenicellales bacterium]
MKKTPTQTSRRSWSVVIPYFNEERFIERTLRSLLDQTLGGFKLILVNNGSTDSSELICRRAVAAVQDIEVLFLNERRPGQVYALEAGIAGVDTDYVAICDADTYYPPHYLSLADSIFERADEETAAVMAMDIYTHPRSGIAKLARLKGQIMSRVFRNQCHTGGYGMCFNTEILKRAGGYSRRVWPYVVKDHELVNRVLRLGRTVYNYDLWCMPSDRRQDRKAVRWDLLERILYHLTPFAMKEWYFYGFLGPRLRRRRQDELVLRDRSWSS